MGAPVKNQFWKMRTKHGRDMIFTDPRVLLKSAYEYFAWTSENPWYKHEAIKSGDSVGTIIQVPTERPFTIEGLTQFLGVNKSYLDEFQKGMDAKTDEENKKLAKDFSQVITHIKEIIYRHKYEGAAVGAFNATIMSRDLGLADKTTNTIVVEQPLFGDDGESTES